jgi:Sec-independent protein translocase protein TatA
MFNIGLPELLIIVLAVIVFISPKQLPGFFRKVGTGVAKIKGMREEFTRSLRDVQEDLGLTERGTPGAQGGTQREGPRRAGSTGAAERRPASWDEGGGI